MAKVYTHPHWETSVIDRSIYQPLVRETLPLFRPMFFMRTQSGTAGVPVWVSSYNDAVKAFGEGTFDDATPYYSREALYLRQLFARQGAFIVRMADSNAKKGSLVLQLRVKKMDVEQFERDPNGQYKLTEDGDRIPLTDSTGATITEPGVELKWTVRELTGTETLKNLKPTTYGSGAGEYTVYPILAAQAKSVGAYSNDTGVKLYVDLDNLDDVLANNIGSLPYSFGAVKKTYGQDTVSPIYSDFQDQVEDFVFKPDQIDTRTDRRVSFDDIIGNYWDTNKLPFELNVFSENVEEVGKLIQDVEDQDDTLTDPFLANLTDSLNMEGVPMPHVVFSEEDDAVVLTDTRILYLMGGNDGDITDDAIEKLTVQYLKDIIYPELLDQPRYPFTHIIDTGVSIATKKAFIQFLGTHDAHKLVLSTQDANLGRFNTKAEDLSTGASLNAACLLQPESVIKGTEVCRAEIYQQSGHLADSNYKGIVPFTYDILMKKSRYMSTPTITGKPGGLPNSEITVFKDWNWTPCDADHKQKSWDTGLNYAQFYDMTSIHWPAMRTVYRYDTSVLSSAIFTDVIVFTKHLARYNWSRYTGVEQEFSLFAPRAAASLSNDMALMLNGMYQFTVQYYQTEEEANIGYISHALIQIWGDPQQRVHKIDIECYRTGFDPNTVEV